MTITLSEKTRVYKVVPLDDPDNAWYVHENGSVELRNGAITPYSWSGRDPGPAPCADRAQEWNKDNFRVECLTDKYGPPAEEIEKFYQNVKKYGGWGDAFIRRGDVPLEAIAKLYSLSAKATKKFYQCVEQEGLEEALLRVEAILDRRKAKK